jgi:hypothetical protein
MPLHANQEPLLQLVAPIGQPVGIAADERAGMVHDPGRLQFPVGRVVLLSYLRVSRDVEAQSLRGRLGEFAVGGEHATGLDPVGFPLQNLLAMLLPQAVNRYSAPEAGSMIPAATSSR